MVDELLSASQAAEYLGITRARINQLATAGKIRREEVGGYFVYRRSELDRWRLVPKSVGGRPKNVGKIAEIIRAPDREFAV